MKTTNFQELALTILMTITTYCTHAQWGLVVIGVKDSPPLNQWYTVDHKDYDNIIHFYGDYETCNSVLDKLLEQYGDDHTTGDVEGDSFTWFYIHDSDYMTEITYVCLGEFWLITSEIFGYYRSMIDPEWIVPASEIPMGVACLKHRNLYLERQWYFTRNNRKQGKGDLIFYGSAEECEEQLDNILSDHGIDHMSGESFMEGMAWFIEQDNGYELIIYYEEGTGDNLSLIIMLTRPIDFSEEMEFLQINW